MGKTDTMASPLTVARRILGMLLSAGILLAGLDSISSAICYGESAQAKLPVSTGIPPDRSTVPAGVRGSVLRAVWRYCHGILCPCTCTNCSNTANCVSLSSTWSFDRDARQASANQDITRN